MSIVTAWTMRASHIRARFFHKFVNLYSEYHDGGMISQRTNQNRLPRLSQTPLPVPPFIILPVLTVFITGTPQYQACILYSLNNFHSLASVVDSV